MSWERNEWLFFIVSHEQFSRMNISVSETHYSVNYSHIAQLYALCYPVIMVRKSHFWLI
jgi:hypothetical protein